MRAESFRCDYRIANSSIDFHRDIDTACNTLYNGCINQQGDTTCPTNSAATLATESSPPTLALLYVIGMATTTALLPSLAKWLRQPLTWL
ncbi:hypothetical protein ISREJYDI_CDS0024 [Pseudomonas phage UNO-G1W1]|uniref:Uncharacterized protein n=1 Tax=Pseudomonas phage UNO-G1W1 TaxID=3136609 RepID=A0AAX4QN62_9CAUD